MRIGIPTTLFACYHLPYWQAFFERLGIEVILSDPSCKATSDRGGRYIPHEFCIPIKVFIGHVLNLLDKEVDLILVPRMVAKDNRNFYCPKLHGLVELVHYSLHLHKDKMFSPEVASNGLNLKINHFADLPRKPLKEMKAAASFAEKYYQHVLLRCRTEKQTLPDVLQGPKEFAKGLLNLGLVGYSYCLYDPFISKELLHHLRNLGANIFTWEMLDPVIVRENLKKLSRPLFWNFGRIMYGAGLHFLDKPEIDGVIYVTTFGCGPDSITMKLLSLEANRTQKPLLFLNLDEHSEDGHLRTRLEAFIDMLMEQKETNLSLKAL